ncbi:hypothetical protein PR048_018419 [Dryococelus australis]|uniref:Integrase catalytic domain-containing protein n=1 Tax=Dryococelus australis TaxID=614101 RepID=A0ABQ9HCE9_9NEOP|nr:hypothetical protein PR048_018419 [Dryococelus australis]
MVPYSSKSSIEIINDIFSRNGFLEVMVSHHEKIFTSEEFAQSCKEAGIFKKFCAAGHLATNSLAERNYTPEQWEVSCRTVPQTTDSNPTECDEADKIPRVTSSNLTSLADCLARQNVYQQDTTRITALIGNVERAPASSQENLGDLTEIMGTDMVLPDAEQPDPIEQEEEVRVVDFQPLEQPAQREHPQLECRLPAYLRDYSLY